MWIYLCCVVALIIAGASAAEKTSTVGNITTKVLGQSGKIKVYRGDNETDGVTITFSGIYEIDTDDNKINSHAFNNFAQLDFIFSELENTTYPNSNISVTMFSFNATIAVDGTDATLVAEVFMFTEDGNITVDGNDVEVEEGNMKFNVKIESWPFCDKCTHGNKQLTGAYLDFDIEMKGAKVPTKTSDDHYSLGGGATLFIPTEVLYDNATTNDMPTGYPKLTTQGSKSIFTFRFEKFSSSALYDPTVALEDDSDADNTTTPAPEGNTKTLSESDVVVEVKGRSGKIVMKSSGSTTGDSKQKKMVTIEFDNLQEKVADGTEIKDNMHSFRTFANQDFKFTTLPDGDYPGTELGSKRITFNSTLTNGAKLMIYMYLFKEAGEINNTETISVEKGTLKFNVKIEDWPFCTSTSTCKQNAIGEYLDFEIVMKGSGNAKKDTSKKTDTYELGMGETATLSRMIEVDGDMVQMMQDYPMLGTQGSKQIFKFRFPKFNQNVMYDPTLTIHSGDNGGSAVHASCLTLIVAVMSLILQKLF